MDKQLTKSIFCSQFHHLTFVQLLLNHRESGLRSYPWLANSSLVAHIRLYHGSLMTHSWLTHGSLQAQKWLTNYSPRPFCAAVSSPLGLLPWLFDLQVCCLGCLTSKAAVLAQCAMSEPLFLVQGQIQEDKTMSPVPGTKCTPFAQCLFMSKVCPDIVLHPIFVHTLSTNRNVVFPDKFFVGQSMDKPCI